MSYHKLESCRISSSPNLISVLSLGDQYLTGVFPDSPDSEVTCGPLELVWSPDSSLLQLAHTYSASEMYGDNYGYRSGLNKSMVDHLTRKINLLEKNINLSSSDLVLDIGSNDATSLSAYKTPNLEKIGIDPTAGKFLEYYSEDIKPVVDFFSKETFWKHTNKPAKVITSLAMFYDLDSPKTFTDDIASCLADDGIWHFEQSYMPLMLRTNSYDTICHEHLEYYSFDVVEKLLHSSGLKVLDVQMNSINGGSFAVTACKNGSSLTPNHNVLSWVRRQEQALNLNTPKPYRDFEHRVFKHRSDLQSLLFELKSSGKSILGYGASTKGNVLLQFCGIDHTILDAVVEINPFKYGKYTPGTNIPIISESQASEICPDYYLLLPWHFKDGILRNESEFLLGGGRFIIPFPEIEII